MDLAPFHPQIVHFVVALGLVGVGFRLVSLSGKLEWTKAAATALLILAGLASIAAVMSGTAAHGPVERIPGAGPAVHEHEEAGEWARNLLLLVALIEVAGLVLRKKPKAALIALYASALAGLVAGAAIYRAGDLGGDLVYDYAGGVGIRSGEPEDVHRLLVAGLYHQAKAARAAGHPDEAQRLTGELVRQVPNDPSVTMLSIESLLRDRQDPQAALAALAALSVPEDNPRVAIQKGMLQSEALAAAGQKDSARAVLEELQKRFPRAQRFVAEALEKLK
jgi:uncharacterized membrane protein